MCTCRPPLLCHPSIYLWSRHPGVGFCTSLSVCMGRIWTTLTIIRGTWSMDKTLQWPQPAHSFQWETCALPTAAPLPHSLAFPARRSCSGWSCQLRTEPGEVEGWGGAEEQREQGMEHYWGLVKGNMSDKGRPCLCRSHRRHSCPWE